jgi:ABC-type transport system involved in cytochrome c biogenesis permease subunit
VHTGALITRMFLQGRPPVTNLYSTAIFIGWGCVILGLLLEWMYRNGIGSVAGAIVAALTLQLAPVLGGTNDTLGNLQAVLNTQFWLATHVTTINIGYAATFMAGVLGCLYVLRGVFSASLDFHARKTFGRMMYGITCFAIFCSFTGTVLGGIWADQSWGRFWGWDPKENGALLIVLVNAIVLHARWCGWVQERGMALLSILSNLIVGWSWFGTNQLGVGLHAYGFSDQLSKILVGFWASQIALFLIGCIPPAYWRSSSVHPAVKRAARSA